MPVLTDALYDINPISTIDRNQWTEKDAEVNMQFHDAPIVYTPLVTWTSKSQESGALNTEFTELLDGDVNFDDISFTAQYLDEALTVDSRSAGMTVKRYADKVQFTKASNLFQQWKGLGGPNNRDWRPVLRGLLGRNVTQKIEKVAHMGYLSGPRAYWTYGGSGHTSFNDLDATGKFDLGITNEWRLRLGQTGSPVVPGDQASATIAIVPPGVTFDMMEQIQTASGNEAALWRDVRTYSGEALKFEVGTHKGVRFVSPPNDKYGINPTILYNCGAIVIQADVTEPINPGDGSPDPLVDKVDGIWAVGQEDVTHYVQLDAATVMTDFALNDYVTIHTKRTADFGVANGVDFRWGKTIVRRIVKIDAVNKRLSFDRPIMSKYTTECATDIFAWVTKGAHIGHCLVLGSRGGVVANVNKGIEFYEPKPVDDFESVWRFVWDMVAGMNVMEANYFENHFVSVSVAKPGGIIRPS